MGWQDRDYAPETQYQRMMGWNWTRSVRRMSVTKALIIINVAVFVLDMLLSFGGRSSPIFNYGAMYTPAVQAGQVWRLITSMFLHDTHSLWHIIFNMWSLYMFGAHLEAQWGRRKFFLVYMICGLLGGLLYMVLNITGWLEPRLAIGASGAILGIIGACSILYPRMMVIVFIIPMRLRTLSWVMLVIYTMNILQKGVNAGGDAAHIAGLLAGAGYAWFTRRSLFTPPAWETSRVIKVKVVPTNTQQNFQQSVDQSLQGEVDRILQKISTQGITSLTDDEKQILKRASRSASNPR
ncbi:MAG: Rhomboid protease GlpG [Phycisphaerae bacterium]|nr:Rhomboid protease GlpG [Phycisphaerae bacterium]